MSNMANHPNRSKKSDNPCRTPAPEAILARRMAAGLTQSGAATIICGTKRGWQFYESGERSMHPGLWKLFWLLTDPLVAANPPPPPVEPNPASEPNPTP